MSEMRNSRSAAQSATVLTHNSFHFSFSHFSFRQYPSLHDIALPSLVDHIPHCHHVRFRPTCTEPCGSSESILHIMLDLESVHGRRLHCLCLVQVRALINRSRQENIYRPSHPQQLPTPLRSSNEPHSCPGVGG
jgi:hypothetical protein